MGILSSLIPDVIKKKLEKKKPSLQLRNNIPKEKTNIKKTFGIYCNAKHGTKDGKLCPKCTAMLATILPKMNRCKYGTTKPICDRCDNMCFGAEYNKIFMEAMTSSGKKMFVKHPIMTVKHKVLGMGVDYAKAEMDRQSNEKKKASIKRRVEKKNKREGKKTEEK